jgi:hypothetical protein
MLEVSHHVHLIVITERVGDFCPRAPRRRHLRLERRVKPDDPRVAFGRKAHLFDKPTLELSDAHCSACGRLINTKRAAPQHQAIGRRGDGIDWMALLQIP